MELRLPTAMLRLAVLAFLWLPASADVVALRDSAGLLHLPSSVDGRPVSLAAAGEILSRTLGLASVPIAR